MSNRKKPIDASAAIDLAEFTRQNKMTEYRMFTGTKVENLQLSYGNDGFGVSMSVDGDDVHYLLSPTQMEYLIQGALELDRMAQRADVQEKLSEYLVSDEDGETGLHTVDPPTHRASEAPTEG